MIENIPGLERLSAESAKAYAAYLIYMRLPAESRSLDAAYQQATNRPQTGDRAPGYWARWSVKYDWVNRAAAHDGHLAMCEQNAFDQLWLERRREARERDWQQGEALRQIIDEALPEARGFVRQTRTVTPGKDGQPDQVVVTLAFDIVGLARVLVEASRLQRLATEQPTDHLELSGAALDAYIAAQLVRLGESNEHDD